MPRGESPGCPTAILMLSRQWPCPAAKRAMASSGVGRRTEDFHLAVVLATYRPPPASPPATSPPLPAACYAAHGTNGTCADRGQRRFFRSGGRQRCLFDRLIVLKIAFYATQVLRRPEGPHPA
jgi:hypothetical protein